MWNKARKEKFALKTHPGTPTRLLSLLLCLILAVLPLLSGCGQEAGSAAEPASAASEATPAPAAAEAPPRTDRRPADPEYDKEETVYAKAAADGKVRSVTVETVLNYAGADGKVEDRSELRDIKNTEGDEEFTQGSGGLLYWEDHGEVIRYEGKSSKALPVSVTISYYLDGKPIAPEKLAGQSGHLRMRFDYENLSKTTVSGVRSGEPGEVQTCVPFLALSLVMLSDEVFSHPEATNGRLLALDDQSVFIGYALPGLRETLALKDYPLTKELEIPEYAELEADVQDFTLDFTATILSNHILEDLETEDLDDLDSFAYNLNLFTDALPSLSDGAEGLADGSQQLKTALAQYTGGVNQINDGAQALSSALSGMNDQLGGARSTVSSILSSLSGDTLPELDSVAAALDDLIGYLNGFLGQLDSLEGYPEQVRSAVRGAAEEPRAQLGGISSDVSGILAETELTAEQQSAILNAVEGRVSEAQAALSLETAVPDSTGFSGSLGSLRVSASTLRARAEALRSSPEQLRQAEELLDQMAGLFDGVNALSQSAAALAGGSASLSGNIGALNEAAGAIASGSKALSDGVGQFTDAALSQLSGLGGWELRNLVTHIRAARLADLRYDNFGGVAAGHSSTVRFIVETDAIE